MDHESDPMARGMTEVFPVTGLSDDSAGMKVELRTACARLNRADRLVLRLKHDIVDHALPG